MILQQHMVKQAYALNTRTQEKPTPSLSVPGQAMNLKLAMEQYKKGSMLERAKGFYEKEGFVCPDFSMMDRIEKLQALADYRILRKESAKKLDDSHNKANQKFNKDVLEQKEAKKRSEEGRKTSDRAEKPDAN